MAHMEENEAKPERAQPLGDERTMSYRCVCGELTRFDSDSSTCMNCGRHYDYDALCGALASTAVLYTDETGEAIAKVAPAANDDQLLGQRLGHFRILERLGSGGMGRVYRALDESLQRYVALKVIHKPAPNADDAGLQGAFQEARAQARVNHPNVAHIYYVGSDADIPFLAMELVGEQTLADRLQDGPLPFDEVILFALQIAEALRHAAMFDIVHGDVKPTNVLLVDDQTVKLSDFGLARRLSQSSHGTLAAGTPEFVAPEVTKGQPADHRSDMYSLGVTLFRMTFGRMPYTPSSQKLAETLRLHRDADVEFPETWPAELPQSWRAVLTRLLEKDPKSRYQEFDELIGDLKRHEPIALPNASPLLRGLAWIVDCFLLSIPLGILGLLSFNELLGYLLPFQLALQGAVVLGFCYLQASFGTTLGKRLFQIRIVDQFGLRPPPLILGIRASLQFIWAWAGVVASLFSWISIIGVLIVSAAYVFIAIEMIMVLFTKGLSIHDRILRTRVVLDAAPRHDP